MKKMLLCTILVLFSIPTIYAQKAVIKGFVGVQPGNLPAQDVMVSIEGMQRFTFTDASGHFELKDIPYGEYNILLNAISIEHQRISLEVKEPVVYARYSVEEVKNMLEEIVIIERTREREIIESGYPVSIIKTDDLERQSISTLEVLDKTAGIKIRESGGLGSRTSVNINGLSGRAIQIYIDGLPISSYGGSMMFSSIPTNLIERIEVYKGVVPAHLASDALGGVINIVLKNTTQRALSLSWQGGSFNTHKATANGTTRIGKHGVVQGSLYWTSSDNDYPVWGDQIYFKNWDGTSTNGHKVKRFHDAFYNFGGRLQAGVQYLPWADKLLLGVAVSKGYNEVQHSNASMFNPYGDRHNRRNNVTVDLTYHNDDLLFEDLGVRLHAAISRQNRQSVDTASLRYDWRGVPLRDKDGKLITGRGGEASNEKRDVRERIDRFTSRGSVSYNFLEHHTLSIDYFLDAYSRDSKDVMRPTIVQKTSDSYRLFKQILSGSYQLSLFDHNWLTNLFGKYYFGHAEYVLKTWDYEEKAVKQKSEKRPHSEVGFGVTTSYKIRPNIMLVASGEKAMRLATPSELFGSVGEDIRRNDNLKPEVSYNVNLGVRAEDLVLARKHLFSVQGNIFLRDTKNMIRQQVHSGQQDYILFENLENVLSRGGDIEVEYNYDSKLRLQSSFSYASVVFNTKYNQRGEPYGYYGMQIRNEPRIRAAFSASYTLADLFAKGNDLTISGDIRYTEAFRLDWGNVGAHNLAIIPAQYPINLGLVYRLKKQHLSLALDAKNILNQQSFDNYGLQKPGFAIYGKVSIALF